MTIFRYSLVTDGSYDRVLRYPIDWLLHDISALVADGHWVDFRSFRSPPQSLSDRVSVALRLYPCDVLFIHRDAERADLAARREEIEAALRAANCTTPHVCLIPVRMTEAWFLHDVAAVRHAAGNPNGTARLASLPLPGLANQLSNPKRNLDDALLAATELTGRKLRRAQRRLPAMRLRAAELTDDFSPLRDMPAFRTFERSLQACIQSVIST